MKRASLGVLGIVQHMHDMVVELALGSADIHELCDSPVPRHVAGVHAGTTGAHVGELRRRVGPGGLGEAEGCGAEQAATASTACDGAR